MTWVEATLLTCYQRISPGISQAIQFQIHIQFRPVQVVAVKQFDVENMLDGRVLKPRKLFVRQLIVATIDNQQDSLGGDVCHFSC